MEQTGNVLLAYVLKLHYDPEEAARFTSSQETARECMTAFGLSAADQEVLLSQQDDTNVAALEQRIASEDYAAPGFNHVQCRIMLTLPNAPSQ